ncbi:MAG TPA: cation:proton antiporter [Terriglobales bacterium]|nr:cation:proton antiporter [Terriglobales bacterium]
MHADIVAQIAIAIVAATIFAFVAKLLRQPVVLGYMAAGLVIGPTEGLGWISTRDIEEISELGLILLLFMIGLEIDLKKLKKAGAAVSVTGLTQFVICFGLGLLVAPLLGFRFGQGNYAPIYFAVAAALSSTMIVVKLLYDKFELDTVAGRITLGVLVFQDLWAILFLGLQTNLANPSVVPIALSVVKGVGLVGFSLLVSRFGLPVLFRSIAKLPELMVIGALGWCFGISMLAARLGLSREMGALIAGVSISTFPYNMDVIAKVVSLRDFFITLFFVTLGARIPRPTTDIFLTAVGASGFLVLSRFLSVTPVLASLKMGMRTSFIPALNLSQISEFSLVICALGVASGHIDNRLLTVIVYMLVLTAVGSTYAIMKNHEIYVALRPVLKKLGMRDLDEDRREASREHSKEILFLGFAQDASSLLHELLAVNPALAERISVVDFNPEVKHELDRRGIECVYGDIGHLDTLLHAHVINSKVLVSTIPDMLLKGTTNHRLLRQLRRLSPTAKTVVTSQKFAEAQNLYKLGATFVYLPRLMSVRELRDVVLSALDSDLEETRQRAMAEIEVRAEVLP